MTDLAETVHASEGYGGGTSGGRPSGTTANEGYGGGTSGGRPSGTTASEGYGVGTSWGRLSGLLVRGMVWVPLGEGRVGPLLSEQRRGQRCSGLLYSQVYIVRLRPVSYH